jgi:hypothetical protein
MPGTDLAQAVRVDLEWLREVVHPESATPPEMLQFLPFLMIISLHSLPKLTPESHVELTEIALTMLTTTVQGLVAEKMINLYAKEDLEAPALREQFKVLAKQLVIYRRKAVDFIDKLLEIPDPEIKKN